MPQKQRPKGTPAPLACQTAIWGERWDQTLARAHKCLLSELGPNASLMQPAALMQAFLQGYPICYSDFTADLRFRTRKLWRDIADMNPLESDHKLVTYHSWFACPLLNLQADSRTRVRDGGAPLMPPRYPYLDLH